MSQCVCVKLADTMQVIFTRLPKSRGRPNSPCSDSWLWGMSPLLDAPRRLRYRTLSGLPCLPSLTHEGLMKFSTDRPYLLLFGLLAFVGLVADQASKYVVFAKLYPDD